MRCIKEREVCNIIPGHLPLESLQGTELVTWHIIIKSPPWIWRWLTSQSKTPIGRIQLSDSSTANLQIYGGNFKLIGHMRSSVICKDSCSQGLIISMSQSPVKCQILIRGTWKLFTDHTQHLMTLLHQSLTLGYISAKEVQIVYRFFLFIVCSKKTIDPHIYHSPRVLVEKLFVCLFVTEVTHDTILCSWQKIEMPALGSN